MQQFEYLVNVKKENERFKAKFTLAPAPNGQTILEYSDNTDNLKEVDAHTHSAFNRIRHKLTNKNKLLLVKGCRFDVHPSGRQLRWIYAYKLTLGKRVNDLEDQVIIFENEDDDSSLVTVQEQKEYYEKWLNSIKGIPY